MMQESTRSFDAFVSAVPDLSDLQVVAETLHVMFLRGYNVKPYGKQAAETAKAILVMTKIPRALIPRLPKFAGMLKAFETLRDFHLEFPAGMDFDGNAITTPNNQWPVFSAASVEKLVSEILLPLMLFKKHGSMIGYQTPLGVPFVRDLLPEVDTLYQGDLADQAAKDALSSVVAPESGEVSMTDESTPVSEEEATKLKKEHEVAKERVYGEMADLFVSQNIVLTTWDADIGKELEAQPMITSQAARLWWFNAGTDTTKDPAKKQSIYRMKSLPDETHLTTMVDLSSKFLTEADTAVVVSGRNQLFMRDARKQIKALKPKVSVKDMEICPDEAMVMPFLRVECNKSGSVDLSDPYLAFTKNSRVWKSRKGAARRFVPGHTAFRTMGGVPVIPKDNMTMVPYSDRENVFKHVSGSDKWAPGKAGAKAGAPSSAGASSTAVATVDSSSESEAEGVPDSVPQVVDTSSSVVLFYMELHSRVCCIKLQHRKIENQ